MLSTIVPSGINRSMSGQNSPDGVCEEILNARYKNGSWRVVGKKKKIVEGVNYEQVFIHKYGSFENYIGVRAGQVIWFDPVTKEEKQTVCEAVGKVVFNQMNNILLVKDDISITKSVFTEGKYDSAIVKIPDAPSLVLSKVSQPIEDGSGYVESTFNARKGEGGKSCGTDEKEVYKEVVNFNRPVYAGKYFTLHYPAAEMESLKGVIQGLYNDMITPDDYNTEGYVFLSVAYQLFDGSVTKSTPFTLVKLGGHYRKELFFIRGFEYKIETSEVIFDGRFRETSVDQLNVSLSDMPDYERYKNIISKVNVYASKPISVYDWENMDPSYLKMRRDKDLYNMRMTGADKEGLPEKVLKASDIEGLLLYRVAQFDFGGKMEEKPIKFSDITTNPTMAVDGSGWCDTTGDMFLYNSRLHLFNLKQTFVKSDRIISAYYKPNGPANEVMTSCVVHIKSVNGDAKVVSKCKTHYDIKGGVIQLFPPDFFAFPDSRAYKVVFYAEIEGVRYTSTLFLTPSSTYNLSFHVLDGKMEFIKTTDTIPEMLSLYDNRKLIVSEATNPYYFPVANSYNIPGEIVDMGVSTEQISEVQTGQFPVYVFTTEGIYALQVGDGNVLYSNIVPVSSQVAIGKVLQTKYGIVFPTQDGIKIISGREIVNLSEAVCGEPDWNIRKSGGFDFCFYDHPELHNAKDYLCDCDFKKYVENAVMGYDMMEDELIVSNPAKRYSFVYGFQSKTWHKITEVFDGFSRTIAYTHKDNLSDIIDLTAESEDGNMFHMHMGPIRLGTEGFKQIERVAARGSFLPVAGKRSSMYVYCSNDAITWQMVKHIQDTKDWTHYWMKSLRSSSRYIALILGGEVRGGHLLSHCEVDYGNVLDRKLR